MDPIPVNILALIGRVNESEDVKGNVYAVHNADYAVASSYVYQFGVQSQSQTFGTPRSIKIDNSSNPSQVEVSVTITDDYFIIPPYAGGVFTVNATPASNITLSSAGGATDKVTTTVYNYPVAPVIWYAYGAFNNSRPVRVEGPMDEGDDVAAAQFNNPVYMGGIDRATGLFHGVRVDATGRLAVSAALSATGVYGADPMGAPPINPGLVQAVLNSAGDITYVQLNAAGEFLVKDTSVLAAVDTLETLSTAANVKLDALIENTDKAVTGTQTSIAGATVDMVILAANANRQGATVFNDSTAPLYLLLANAVSSTSNFSVQIAAGGYYEVPAKYNGIIKGIWSGAFGFARVTELV